MGLRMLATLGLAALFAGVSQMAWTVGRSDDHPIDLGPGVADRVFRDCADCPEMVVIPAGRFVMGTTEAQKERLEAENRWNGGFADELPAREIAVPEFALARTEVTLSQFRDFIDATGYRPSGVCWGFEDGEPGVHERLNWRAPGFAQGADHPVVCVTWWDAQAYARWLSLKTGEAYRLPSEAEWEYAARADAQTQYFWGDDPDAGCAFANGADETAQRTYSRTTFMACDDGAFHTAPVASYQPNAFGLSDMAGNVFEWVEDCYGDYEKTHTGSAAVVTGDCSSRVIRGGSRFSVQNLRSAHRSGTSPVVRSSGSGFRLARTL